MSDKLHSRRNFLKGVGTCTVAALAGQLLAAGPASGSAGQPGEEKETWGMLIDLTRCEGCDTCTLACKEANGLSTQAEMPTELSSDTFTFINTQEVTLANGNTASRHVKTQCMHCVNPACVSACPAAAMYKSEAGPVVYRPERCLGCRYCQMACPFGVPSFEWDNGVTPVINKCWMCAERLKEGQQPACVESCPTGALRFGTRSALLAQAHAQIESNPERYVDHVFGEFEVGGTSVLYLSDVPFEELDFPENLPESAPPEETEKIMNALPPVIAGTAALMAAVSLVTHRKQSHPKIIHEQQEE